MTSEKPIDNAERLRARAENRLSVQPEQNDTLDPREMRHLLHELQVHQIELEIQNEELRTSQKNMEEMRNRYMGLYQNAPIGYIVIDKAGIVKQANRCFARMAGADEISLRGKAFPDILMAPDAAIFRSRFRAFFNSPEGKRMDLRIAGAGDTPIHVQLEALPHDHATAARGQAHEALLMTVTDITDRRLSEMVTEKALQASESREREVSGLLKGARAILEKDDFQITARRIFDACRALIGATSGYVALLSEDGHENEVLFLEAGGLPCDVDPELPMPIRGLRADAYRENRTVFHNDFMNSPWVRFMPRGHVHLKNVLFAPLVLDGKTVGIMGLANKPQDFDDNDRKLATGFGELAAIALRNSRQVDARNRLKAEREKTIAELQKALNEVRTLSGFIPICANCKNVRDDEGYWKRIEHYVQDHSEADFSHSICPDCAKKLYPDMDIYDDAGSLISSGGSGR